MRNMWYNIHIEATAQRQLPVAWPNLVERIDMPIIPQKHCNKCNSDKPLSEFSKKAGAADGKQTQCKSCVAAYYAAYYQKNKTTLLQKFRSYRTLYYECNREKLSEKGRIYRTIHPDRMHAFRESWNQRNPNNRRERVLRRRARIRKNRVEKVDYSAIWERDQGICHICGGPVESSDVHYDHVIALVNGGAHSMDNIKVAHSLCNMRKGAR